MADFRHSTPAPNANPPSHDRRSFLAIGAAGMAAAIAVSAAAPASASPASIIAAKFDAADQAFIAADKAMHDFGDGELERAHRAFNAWRDQWPKSMTRDDAAFDAAWKEASLAYDPVEARYDELFEVSSEAMAQLISTPAPDTNAVARKLDVLIVHDAWDCASWEESIGHVLADLRRLGSAA